MRSPTRCRSHGIADVLDPLFALFAAARADGEGFGDFCHRIGMPGLQQTIAAPTEGRGLSLPLILPLRGSLPLPASGARGWTRACSLAPLAGRGLG